MASEVQTQLRRSTRTCVVALSVVSLAAAHVPLARILSVPASAQVTSSSGIMSRAEYEACQARDESAFRTAIEDLTFKGLRAGLAGVDYRAVVNEEWKRSNFDATVDTQVDVAVNEVREETSWTALIKSIGSEEQAKALATTIAERVYKSEPVKKALEDLATGVGRAVGKRIELATGDTAEPAMQCMQAFLGPRYGSTIARAVSRDAGKEYAVDPNKAQSGVSTGAVLAESAGGLTGAIILIVRRQMANMASRIGSRIVGSVLSRVVGAVAGGIGLVLIAKDIWEFRNGVLPIIASEMKSKATKDKVQEELSRAVQEQIGENLKEISSRTADRVLEIWKEFKLAHAKVLALADLHPTFRAFLERISPDQLPRLDEVTALVAASEGDDGVMKRLADGSLADAVYRLPESALTIARDTRSLATAMDWWRLAGTNIDRVTANELHRIAVPGAFDAAALARVLELGDRSAISRLAALPRDQRATLFELDGQDLKKLAVGLSQLELSSLAGYMTRLDKAASGRILRTVAHTPSRMQILARPAVSAGIVASRDQSAAVGMMLRTDGVPDVLSMFEHARLVTDGRVAPVLLWEKHPAFVVTISCVFLLLLLVLRRIVFRRRPTIVVQSAPAPTSPAPRIKTSR